MLGEIIEVCNYGYHVELSTDVVGLVHKSEITYFDRKPKTENYYKKGDKINVKLLKFNEQRVDLSIKQVEPNPYDIFIEQNQVGDVLNGVISNCVKFGYFVELVKGVEGLAHIKSNMNTQFNQGDRVSVEILSINNKKIALKVLK
ncbi:70 kDa antigen [Phocoenobacter uteri]|uniref:70 kDa antigen n=2 Tax=Phocoenobacter uteri TaxID=146806 RepID=A0A379CBQ5_9PAST|nr:hypothetical protein [Phocoenobacter uteri]SUB59107.1 70 kDa antigen [Phocoenobacter uteri]